MREFNIFGPVNPTQHYYVDRVAVKSDLRDRIERGRYMTLNASRQTGKTTLFREVIAELETTGDYFGILLNFEKLVDFEKDRFYKRLGILLNHWRKLSQPTTPDPTAIKDHGDFIDWLRNSAQVLGKKGLLIIDEFDAVDSEIIKPILSLFRGMYQDKKELGEEDCIHSIILVGVRNLPSLLQGTQSPFNIADQFTVPYFTPAEVKDLLTQHTAETGQVFEPEVIDGVVNESEGQPFLVNRLAQILTVELVRDRSKLITRTNFNYAMTRLLTENNTHFYSIISKASPHRQLLLPILLYNQSRSNFLDPATQELIMYGVLRVLEDAQQLRYARIGNPIYRKMLMLRFVSPDDTAPVSGLAIHRYLVDGHLNFDGLLDHFKAFMNEHGVTLLKSTRTERPMEISGQYLLLSYLTSAMNILQGFVTIESLSSAGGIDILVFFQGNRFIVETKVWYDKSKYEAGKKQLANYLQAASLHKGYMMIFDEHLEKNPLLAEQGELYELEVQGKTLRIYLIGVTV